MEVKNEGNESEPVSTELVLPPDASLALLQRPSGRQQLESVIIDVYTHHASVPDAVDHVNRVVRELKPNTASGLSLGPRQLQRYLDQLYSETGYRYTGYLDTYQP